MRDHTRAIVGLVIIGIGLILLLGTVFHVNVWAFCGPVGLIGVGIWLLVRSSMVGPGTRLEQRVLGDIRREGAWEAVDEEIWLGVGDLHLDMREATIPAGKAHIRAFGFVGDVDLILPEGIGVSVSSLAFLTDGKVFGKREQSFVVPLRVDSDDYETAERTVHLDTYFLVVELTVQRA